MALLSIAQFKIKAVKVEGENVNLRSALYINTLEKNRVLYGSPSLYKASENLSNAEKHS